MGVPGLEKMPELLFLVPVSVWGGAGKRLGWGGTRSVGDS